MRTLAISLAALLVLSAPALASSWPERYTVRDAAGAELGSLALRAAGTTPIRKREAYQAELQVCLEGRALRLAGTVNACDDMLKGVLREVQGLAGVLASPAQASREWEIRLGQGLRNTIELRQGSQRHQLSAQAALGARNRAHEDAIRRFYEAFQAKDAATMAELYADDVHFSDRVFPDLRGEQAGAMWAMLCESEDLELTFSDVRADDRYGVARWEARYTVFGSQVHNVIQANFEFRDGKVVRHVDQFDFARWVGQALPGPSKLLGPTSLLKTIRLGLVVQLRRFMLKR